MYTTHRPLNEGKKLNYIFFWWLVTAAYMGTIFYLSSVSTFKIPALPQHFDKIVHTLIYIPLAFLLYISLKRSGLRNKIFLIAFLAAGLYGITDELHQSFVPGRIPSTGDVIADFTGAFIGSVGASFLKT